MDFTIASPTSHNEFAQKVALFCGIDKSIEDEVMDPRVFTGGEFCPRVVNGNVAGKRVYLVATPDPVELTPQDLSMRICICADALRNAGAKEVVLVATDLHFSRQDRGPHEDEKFVGQAETALVQARNFALHGISRILTIHPHSKRLYRIYGEAYSGRRLSREEKNNPAIQEEMVQIGKKVLIALSPAPVIAHYLRFHSSLVFDGGGENIVQLAPDKGAFTFNNEVNDLLFCEKSTRIYCEKIRAEPNDPDKVHVTLGAVPEGFNLNGKSVIICDDGSETVGTLMKAAKGLVQSTYGTPASVLVYFTHPWLCGKGYRGPQSRICNLPAIKEVIMGNTWPYIEKERIHKFKKNSTVLRFASYIAHCIGECLEKGNSPVVEYKYENLADLKEHAKELYDIKRSTLHFLEKRKTQYQGF